MKTTFTDRFIAAVASKVPPGTALPNVLVELLGQNISTVYRKLRGDNPFTLEEVLKIANHFSVSIDAHGLESPSRVSGELPALLQTSHTPVDYLAMLDKQLAWTASLPRVEVWYATQEVPVFYYFLEPELLAFKLFMWNRTNGHAADHASFHPDEFQARWPDLEPLRTRMVASYFKIDTLELWPAMMLEHTLRQIAVARYAQIFASADTAPCLYQALLRTVEHMRTLAVTAKRTDPGGGRFTLYFNDVAYTNNTALVCSNDEPVAVFSAYDNPHFLVVRQPLVVRRMFNWLNTIRQQAIQISGGGERFRQTLFDHYQQQVMAAWEKTDRGELM
jgi:hypothetical protein